MLNRIIIAAGILGLAGAAKLDGIKIFHAGTSKNNGTYFTSGGRVLGVTARAAHLSGAVDKAYQAVSQIGFEGAHYRRDIAAKAVKV